MTSASARLAVLAGLAFLPLGAAGCLCPPCPGATVPATAGGGLEGPAPTVTAGSRLVVWDGDNAGTGAQGWDACDAKSGCSKVSAVPGVGINGSTGLRLHGDGPGWLG